MHEFLTDTRITLTPKDGSPYEAKDLPPNSDEIVQKIERSTKSDGIVLNVTQNLEFIGGAKDLILSEKAKGLSRSISLLREDKYFDTFEAQRLQYLQLSSAKTKGQGVKIDQIDNDFQVTLANNVDKKFELDRLTDINGNAIPALETSQMRHKPREIFLQSELDKKKDETILTNTPYISIPLEVEITSDNKIGETFNHTSGGYFVGFNTGDTTKTFPEGQQFFYNNNDRSKTLQLKLDLEFDITFNVGSSQFFNILLQKSSYDVNTGFAPVELYTIASLSGADISGEQTISFNNVGAPFNVTLDETESLCLIINLPVDASIDNILEPVKYSLRIEEDSIYEPINENELYVDCVPVKDALTRLTQILDSSVRFESDYLDNNFDGLVVFSGETLRHVYYLESDDPVNSWVKAPICTTSLNEIKGLLSVKTPLSFGIVTIGAISTLRLEPIEWFYDKSRIIHLGKMSNIETETNLKKTFSGVKIGYTNSGENDEIFGLQVMHAVTEWTLPPSEGDIIYEATSSVVVSPEEIELTYRKQWSQFPDESTERDNQLMAVDCEKAEINEVTIYVPYGWQEHFTAVSGVYRPDSSYNFRLSPINCMPNHASNFKQEFYKSDYTNKKVLFLNSTGSIAMKTTPIGGVERQENADVLLSDLDDPILTNDTFKGDLKLSRELVNELNGYTDLKPNAYFLFSFDDDDGVTNYGFTSSHNIKDKITTKLNKVYGF